MFSKLRKMLHLSEKYLGGHSVHSYFSPKGLFQSELIEVLLCYTQKDSGRSRRQKAFYWVIMLF